MLIPLLQTKFYVPPPPPHLVRRDHLIGGLQDSGARRLTLVSAPAGFGKTTLVSAWSAQCDQAVAWLALDDDDNDPTRFLTYLIAALQTCDSQLGETALALLAAPQAPPPKAILALLLNDLGKLTVQLALVLDDYHAISAPPLHEAVTFLIDHLPSTLRLIIATRIDPPLPLARWRVRNQLAEVRADDLRFRPAEAATFLNDVMELTLSAAEIAALETRTEGWIAGLQLAALSIQGRSDVADFIQAFSGSHRHVLSYLVEEVLNRRPEGTLDFLLQTAILDQLTAPLCNAVTGRRDSQTLLEKLEQANLFLIPLDDESKWYRYHHLFAEVLRTRLQQIQLEIIPQLHQRASTWYAAAGQLEQAVGHALAVPDVEQAATLIEGVALATVVQQSEVRLVRRLIERLPVTAIYSRPHLTLAYGFTLALSGQFDAVATLLRQAAPALNSVDLPGEVAGGLAALQSTMARFRGDLDQSLGLAQQALHKLPVDVLALRALAALNRGVVYLQQGDRETAGQILTDAVTWGSAAGADYIVLAAVEELTTEQTRQGHLAQAKQTCEQALARVTRGNNQRVPAAGMLHVILGEVLVERNELEQATRALTQGVQLLQRTTEMGMLVRGYSALARSQGAGGEREAALATLQQGEEWLAQIQTAAPRTHARLAVQRARLQVWQGDLVAALPWAQEPHPLGETLLSYLQQLTHVRIQLVQYARDPQTRFLAEAANILASLLVSAEAKGWGGHVIEILLLQALLELAQGQRTAAQTLLIRAITLAEPEGFIRIFVDEGEPMRKLIVECAIRNAELSTSLRIYVDKLLAAFDQEKVETKVQEITPTFRTPHSEVHPLVEPLSARELEVLQLVAAGLSNTQIATQLIVTTGTIKTHINHIFGKLAVESRIQAVVRARELGLLGN